MEMLETEGAAEAVVDEASTPYLGQWRGLISTTNWEKGRIICEWRDSLRQSGASALQGSDEAWSRRAGQVSAQHVGRLRRVFERFGAVRREYPGLYWSHFQAALEFNDAEMWLEGAVQNAWSVSEMRSKRWETLGALPHAEPREDEIVTAEFDEDVESDATTGLEGKTAAVRDVGSESEDADFEEASDGDDSEKSLAAEAAAHSHDARTEPLRPFAGLAELPDDLHAAFEAFKLAILRHKLAGWAETRRDDVLASLDALKQLAIAPADRDE